MRMEVIQYLDSEPDLWRFIRINPEWYHKLSRHPEMISEIKQQADDFFGRSFKKRVENVGEYLGMINMLMEMSALMNGENNEKT